MKQKLTNQNRQKSVYEPVEVQVCTLAPAGVLCASGGMGLGFDDMSGSAL